MRIPSLQTLRAFDAAGRHQSYSRAGEELGLTHSAVSHRIRDLEQLTGARLFAREGNRMVPTQAGRRLLAQVRNALGLLESIFGARHDQPSGRITVSVFPAFASCWLVPRLGAFRTSHPEIDLALDLSSEVVELGDGIDAAIRYGAGSWPGTDSRRLAEELLFPVCTPHYRDAQAIAEPADLLRCTLLRHPWQSWAAWFAAAGVSAGEPTGGPEYSDSSLLVEAAIAGEGVALARALAVFDALRAGTLVRPFDAALTDAHAYYFVTPAGAGDQRLDRLEAWLAAAMREDGAAIRGDHPS
jgi:LysR family transcriptional regulator, glycine cleavage system transcriptional activator